MFLRFLGRIFLYFIIIPNVTPLAKNVLHSIFFHYVEKALEKVTMTPESRESFDRYLRSMSRPKQDYTRS